MKRWIPSLLVLAVFLGFVLPAHAEGAVNISIDDLNIDDFPKMKVFVTVRDAKGIPIAGVQQEQFEIVEDGQFSFPPLEVNTQVNPEAAVSVALAIDLSGSMKGNGIEGAVAAANALLDRLSAQDRVAIVAFADKVDLDPAKLAEGKEIDFTADKDAVREMVNQLPSRLGWDTPLYDAVYKAITLTSREPVGKRAIIVMTDGRDERDNAKGTPVPDKGSLVSKDDPINEARNLGIPVFTIGLGAKIDAQYLTRLALITGGTYHQTPKAEELPPLVQGVVDQLKQQYVLAYDSNLKKDANPHSLMVRVQLPQGQAFDETKLQFAAEPIPTTPLVIAPSQPVRALAQATDVPAKVASAPGPAPTATPESIIDQVRDTISDRPLLAVVIGVGLLILIALIVTLVLVLARGRRAKAEPPAEVEIPEQYPAAAAEWSPTPSGTPTPMPSTGYEAGTEVAPGWPTPGAEMPPFAQPTPGVPMGPEGAAAGGTRLIERAPKHLAVLVDKRQPQRKFDVRGIMNVGRAQDNQIVLDHPTVSRHHAWIREEQGDFLVFDVGSANGSYVNDQRIQEPYRLQNGDTIRFGDVELVFTKVF